MFECFPSFLHFLTSLIKLILWLKFFYRQKAGGGHGEGKDYRILLHFNISLWFNLQFIVTMRVLSIFSCVYLPSRYLPEWSACSTFDHLKNWVVCFLIIESLEFFICPGWKSFIRDILAKIFFPVCGLSFYSQQCHLKSLSFKFWRSPVYHLFSLMDCAFGVTSKTWLYPWSQKFS